MPTPARRVPDYFQRSPIAYGLAMVAFIGAMLSAWLMRTHEATLEAASIANRLTAQSLATNVEGILRAADDVNRLNLDWARIETEQPHVDALLRAQKAIAPHFLDLLLLDSHGNIIHWTGSGSPPEVRDRPYYTAHFESPGRDIFVDEPRPSRVHAGKWFFSLSRAMRTPAGELERVAVAIIDNAMLEETLRRLSGPHSAAIFLMHRNGLEVAHSKRDLAAGTTDLSGYINRSGEIRGKSTLGWAESVGTFPLSVVVEGDRMTALAPWRERAWVGIGLFALGSTVIMLLAIRQGRQAKNLAEAESRYRALTEQSLIGIMLVRDSRVFYANPRLSEILGLAPDTLKIDSGLIDLVDIVEPGERERAAAQLASWQLDPDAASTMTLTARRGDGTSVEIEAQGRQVQIDGRPAALVVVSDISDQVLARRELRQMAYHDALTGLPNRALMFDRLSQAVARSHRTASRFALMLVDLDGFKAVNDTLGHEAGDVVLCAIADRLRAALRESDTVARMGGDEFLIILATTVEIDDAKRVAHKLLGELARPIPVGAAATGTTAQLSGSIGIAMFPQHGNDIDALIGAADAAMYAAKRGGKNNCVTAESSLPGNGTRNPAAFIEWTDEHRLGIEAMDADHRLLFERGNELAAKFGDDENSSGRIDALNALRDDAIRHFANEERLMAASDYPAGEGHARAHREIERKLATLEHLLLEHGPSLALRMLKDWMVVHVNTVDRQFADYLHQRGKATTNAAVQSVGTADR